MSKFYLSPVPKMVTSNGDVKSDKGQERPTNDQIETNHCQYFGSSRVSNKDTSEGEEESDKGQEWTKSNENRTNLCQNFNFSPVSKKLHNNQQDRLKEEV